VQAGERELHLSLDASGTAHPASRCALEHVIEQGALADPGLAAQDQDLTAAGFRSGHEAAQRVAFASSSQQTGP
jgi:hypothetical protein